MKGFILDFDPDQYVLSEDLLELYLDPHIVNKSKTKWSKYIFDGYGVPRVNEILDAIIGKPGLMYWAANLGYSYKKERERILDVGTVVHEQIANWFLTGKIDRSVGDNKSNKSYNEIGYCLEGFRQWTEYSKSLNRDLQMVAVETPIVCPWYGGTIDLIVSMNNNSVRENYIIDFKTSKSVDYSYWLQLYAYYWATNWRRLFDESKSVIDGIGVVRLSKDGGPCEEFYMHKDRDAQFFASLDYSWRKCVEYFYTMIKTENDMKYFMKG